MKPEMKANLITFLISIPIASLLCIMLFLDPIMGITFLLRLLTILLILGIIAIFLYPLRFIRKELITHFKKKVK